MFLGDFARPRKGGLLWDAQETKEVCVLKGLFRFVLAIAAAAVVAVGGINACVVLSANPAITTLDKYEQSRVASCDAIVVLGASVLPDGSLSPILQKRVDAAIDLYFKGVAPIVVMSGDGRESNYDEPNAMKAYAIAQGVPESAIYCDGGGYHTYDTMWRVANVYGAQSVAIVTQKYHQYRAVFDAQGVGMSAVGVVSDTGTYDDQAYYDIREWPARVQDAISVWTGAEPDNPGEAITL